MLISFGAIREYDKRDTWSSPVKYMIESLIKLKAVDTLKMENKTNKYLHTRYFGSYRISEHEGSGESEQMRRHARAFTAHRYKVWMQMKVKIKFKTSNFARYVRMVVCLKHLRIYDKYQFES